METFINGAELSLNSAKSGNLISKNQIQFKNPVSDMCLAGTVEGLKCGCVTPAVNVLELLSRECSHLRLMRGG